MSTERQEKQPAASEVTEVAPDILRMQLPIDLPGLGHVNCYGLVDDRGIALVDPGLPNEECYVALGDRLAQAGYAISDVHSVIVTHSHPDHFGGAGILRSEAGAEVVTHEDFRTWLDALEDDTDPDALDDGVDDDDLGLGSDVPWMREQPWKGGRYTPPPEVIERFRAARRDGSRWMQAPAPSVRVRHDQVVTYGRREWVAVHTPGHTNDHLCLFSPADGIVLTGDHVLPTITPHISGLAAADDPLHHFFASLDLMARLEGTHLALPAHGHPFTDLAGRCDEIKEHHEERLEKLRLVAEALGETDVVSYSHELFRERSWGPMAESETYAHLEHLRKLGHMTSRRVGEDLHFALTPELAEQRD